MSIVSADAVSLPAALSTTDIDANFLAEFTASVSDSLKSGNSLRNCGVLTSEYRLKQGRLSDYWAQEIIGADLLKELLKKASPLSPDFHLVSVWDTGFKTAQHGDFVKNLIADSGPHSLLPPLSEKQMSFFSVRGRYEKALKQLLNNFPNPSFLNNSMGNSSEEVIQSEYKAFAALVSHTVIVKSSGNDYLKSARSRSVYLTDKSLSQDHGIILVGSLSPKGLVSRSSQEGKEVYILAPSDHYITTRDKEGEYGEFSGTSGAAPLVTGALAGFEWLSGWHPTAEEAKLLLKNTVTATIHSQYEFPQRNGVGLLNAYRLGRVALRLKEKCGQNRNCFQEELLNEETYLFSADSNLQQRVDRVFPECALRIKALNFSHNSDLTLSSLDSESLNLQQERVSPKTQTKMKPFSCKEKREVFTELRKAALLGNSGSLWQTVSCIYKINGFSENGLGAGHMGRMGENPLPKVFEELLNEDLSMALRLAGNVGGTAGEHIIRRVLSDSRLTPLQMKLAAYAAGVMGDQEGINLWQGILDKDPENNKIKINAAYGFGQSGGEVGKNVLMSLFDSAFSDSSIWKAVAKSLKHKKILSSAFDVQKAVIYSAVQMEGKEGENILISLAKREHLFVLKNIANALAGIRNEVKSQNILNTVLETLSSLRGAISKKDMRNVLYYIGDASGSFTDTKQTEDIFKKIASLGGKSSAVLFAGKISERINKIFLNKFVTDKDPEVQYSFLFSLRKLPDGEEKENLLKIFLENNLSSMDLEVKKNTAEAAGLLGGIRGADILNDLMNSNPSLDLKISIAYAVPTVEGSAGTSILRVLGKDTDPELQTAVIASAAKMKDKQNAESVFRSLLNNHPHLPHPKEQAAYYAHNLGIQPGVRLLLQLAEEKNPDVQSAVARGAEYLGDTEGAQSVLKFLLATHPNSIHIREKVAYAAGEIGGERGMQILQALAEDKAPAIQKAVVWASIELEANKAEDILNALLEHHSHLDYVTSEVISVAHHIGQTRGIRVLKRILIKNPGFEIRKEVVLAAKKIGSTRGEEILIALTEDENFEVQEAASMSLLQLREERR